MTNTDKLALERRNRITLQRVVNTERNGQIYFEQPFKCNGYAAVYVCATTNAPDTIKLLHENCITGTGVMSACVADWK